MSQGLRSFMALLIGLVLVGCAGTGTNVASTSQHTQGSQYSSPSIPEAAPW